MLELNAKTALVVIDLQEGILPFAGGPHRADEVVERAASLAKKCRQQGSPVVMVRVGWSADFAEALKQPVDARQAPNATGKLVDYPLALEKQESDIEVTKRQWGHLRHRPGAAASPSRYRYDYPVRYLHQYRRRIYGAQRLGAGL
jgi:nicotinamidase-related amidase